MSALSSPRPIPAATPPEPARYRLSGAEDERPVLVVLHQETSTPGRVGHLLHAHGVRLDIRRPVIGDKLPERMDEHRGAIVFGGPPSVNDGDDYLKREIDWISVPLGEGTPLLGICLGAQMMAKQLGGQVGPHPDGLVEVGYYPLEVTPAGQGLVSDWPPMIYQWHREGFDLPAGAELLATGERFPNQAFRYGENAYGIQFHAELTLAMVHRWTVHGHERLTLPGAQLRRDHFDGRAIYDAPVRRWLDLFLTRIFGRPDDTR